MHGRLVDKISISVFLFNQVVHKDRTERLQTAVLKLDVQDSTGCFWFTYMWDGSLQGSGMVSPSNWSVRWLMWLFPASHVTVTDAPVKVITRETACGLLVLVCCVSVSPWVRIQRARCWCITVNWQSAPTVCCSLLPRCRLLQKRRETLEGGSLCYLFSVSRSIHAHKVVIMRTNCTSCHIFARQETDLGHLENANAT